MAIRARLRESEVLAAQVAALSEEGGRPAGDFECGALAALRWLLEGGPGPATGEVSRRPTTTRSVVRELAAAEALIYGPRSERVDYVRGVEHALMWAQFVTCSAPAPDITWPGSS